MHKNSVVMHLVIHRRPGLTCRPYPGGTRDDSQADRAHLGRINVVMSILAGASGMPGFRALEALRSA